MASVAIPSTIGDLTFSVLIVEDEPRCREAFVQAVDAAPDLCLVGAAADLPEGIRGFDETLPDVLLVDVGLPSGSGVELIRHAHRRLPACEIMVVTVFADEQVVFGCIEAGATGYLLKDACDVDIAAQIRLLREGGSPITPSIARRLLVRLGDRPPAAMAIADPGISLSAQEQAVLALCGKGYSYEEIASLLKLSRRTVETYVKRIYRKLQVHSKTEAVYEARKLGLVPD
ncbi:MAG: response regulator transcription factor [Methylococcaceae bacterium]|nr:response regulator transcription factor [Methylococcaceae bacterium]